jgi:Aminotransferase class-V
MTPVMPLLQAPAGRREAVAVSPGPLDIQAIRSHFTFPELGRIVTNNAASTQPPRELVALYRSLAPGYENVHRGQSSASQQMTALFEQSYGTIAQFIGAPGRASIALYRNTTEAINAVMYSLLTEFRDGDNVVTTMMEHNSNYVPWYAMCREVLPRLGRHVEYRLARRWSPGWGCCRSCCSRDWPDRVPSPSLAWPLTRWAGNSSFRCEPSRRDGGRMAAR